MGESPAFGNMLRLREEARDAWGWRWLDDLVHDTRFAWRTLRHSPAFALTAIVTPALGLGVNSGMFSFVNGLLVRPLYEGGDDVWQVHSRRTDVLSPPKRNGSAPGRGWRSWLPPRSSPRTSRRFAPREWIRQWPCARSKASSQGRT
ncbi:MAG TPA: hypothetical protein VN716_01480 [Vicinamibacterales bacterium]|nr:hypothetical protein [Vicinamibacterales bacterium]